MTIATIIYCLIMALMIWNRAGMREQVLDFHSSNVAKACAMMEIEGLMKFFTIVYLITIFIIWV